MDRWEFTKIIVSRRPDDKIDFVVSTGAEPLTDTNHETLKIRFNVTRDTCHAYMQKLCDSGWEPASDIVLDEIADEAYLFKRKIE